MQAVVGVQDTDSRHYDRYAASKELDVVSQNTALAQASSNRDKVCTCSLDA